MYFCDIKPSFLSISPYLALELFLAPSDLLKYKCLSYIDGVNHVIDGPNHAK